MLYDKKLMKSHSSKYRMLQIPHSVATKWVAEGVERVSVEHIENGDYLIVRPQKGSKAKVSTKATMGIATKPEQDHSAVRHFGFE